MSDTENKTPSANPVSADFKNPTPTIEFPEGNAVDIASFDGSEFTSTKVIESDSVTFGDHAKDAKAGNVDGTASDDTEATGSEAGATDEGESDGTDGDQSQTEGGDDEATAELPEWDFGNEEVVAAYDKKYTHEVDGKQVINLNAFNQSLADAQARGEKPNITAAEREYLKDSFGISDKLIDDHIDGLISKAEAYDAGIKSRFDYDAALEWARGGEDGKGAGYTPEQKARFNEALKQFHKTGDHSVLDEQIDLLEARFAKANPGAKTSVTEGAKEQERNKSFRDRRPSSPQKQAKKVTTSTPAGEKLFTSTEEHRIAQNEAIRSGDPKQVEAVRRRLKASMNAGTIN